MNTSGNRTRHLRFAIVCALMSLTCLALHYCVDTSLSDSAGVRVDIPPSVGDWTAAVFQYCHNEDCPAFNGVTSAIENALTDACGSCGAPLHAMSDAENKALPGDTKFIKAVYSNSLNRNAFVSIVVSGRERNSIHRPQRCLVGQGFYILNTDMLSVPLHNREDLAVKLLEITRRNPESGTAHSATQLYAYWFVGQGRETPHHLVRMFWLAWDRVAHGVAHKWAYIAVSSGTPRSSQVAKQDIADFIADFYPRIAKTTTE